MGFGGGVGEFAIGNHNIHPWVSYPRCFWGRGALCCFGSDSIPELYSVIFFDLKLIDSNIEFGKIKGIEGENDQIKSTDHY